MHTRYLPSEEHPASSSIAHGIIKMNIALLLAPQNEETQDKRASGATITSSRPLTFLDKDACNDIGEPQNSTCYDKCIESTAASTSSWSSSNRPNCQSQGKWSDLERSQLRELRHEESMKWEDISIQLGRSMSSYWHQHQRYIEPSNRSNRRGKWSDAESSQLRELRQNKRMKWEDIGKQLGRSHDSCRHHYRTIKQRGCLKSERFQ